MIGDPREMILSLLHDLYLGSLPYQGDGTVNLVLPRNRVTTIRGGGDMVKKCVDSI